MKNEKTNYETRKENHTLKPATIQKWKNYISAILSYAEKLQLIQRNWCKGLKISYSSTLSSIDYKNEYIFDFISIDGICSWFDKWQRKNNLPNITF